MAVTLFAIGSTILLRAIFAFTLTQSKTKWISSGYFVTTADEDDILALQKKSRALPRLRRQSFYTSRDAALAAFFKRVIKTTSLLCRHSTNSGDNPLGATRNVKAKDPSTVRKYRTVFAGKKRSLCDGSTIGIRSTTTEQRRHRPLDQNH